MKKWIVILLVIGSLFMITGCNKEGDNKESEVNNEVQDKVTENATSLVLYFSATNTTEGVAKKIAEVSGSDIVEIVPKDEYTTDDLDYNNDDCRANKEQNDDTARPEIENEMNLDMYDVIYLGYPIWWGTNPKIILTLLDTYDLSDKTVIPFCTSGGSGIETSVSELKAYKPNINWLDGKRFSSSVSNEEITTWINNLDIGN